MLEKTFRIMFKGVHSKILFFCLRLSQVNFQLFHSRKFQPPRKCPLSWTGNSCRKRLLRRPPFWNCLGSEGLFVWRHSVWPEIGGKDKNLQLTWHFHKVNKIYFFPSYYPVLQCHHSEFGTCLAQNNMAQEKLFGPTLGRNDTKTRPGCWVLFKMAATMFEFWASLETNLIRKICTSEAETSVSG